MDKDIINVLSYFNLNDKEARVYLAGLMVGQGTAYQIAKNTGIKRPTVYVVIEELVKKGLMTLQKEEGKTLCLPVSPKRLIETWKGRVEALEAIGPDLNVYFRQSQNQPKVQVFEGESGVNGIYSEFALQDTKNDELLAFGTISAVEKHSGYVLPLWRKIVKNKRNRIRELMSEEPGITDYAQELLALGNPNYDVRISAGHPFGQSDNFIYGSKIAIISLKSEPYVVVIESAEVAKTYKAIFELAWQSAKKIGT